MTFADRFKRLLAGLNLTKVQLAEIFGVDVQTMSAWCSGESVPQFEFQQTLARLESENMPALSPHLKAETIKAFREGRQRGLEIIG